MPTLERFDTPGRVRDLSEADREAWNRRVAGMFAKFAGFPQLYDPTQADTPADAQPAPIVWAAFPARLLRGATSEAARWEAADASRDEQDEYCEWAVQRHGDTVTRVTFTTEVPEYWDELHRSDPDQLRALYHQFVDPTTELDQLVSSDGVYDAKNAVNRNAEGGIAHLSQENNALEAAVALVAVATVQRDKDGVPVTTKQALALCAGLGDPFRNSDPQIAVVVNGAASTGDQITLADPPGLYIDRLDTTGMRTPDGTNPATFWTVERGDPGFAVRASFSVPDRLGYAVGDITLDDRPIRFGAQLADRVSIRIGGIVKAGDLPPLRRPCNP